MILHGSICLSEIPREVMKKVLCKDGKERVFLNIAIIKRKEISQFGATHFLTCSPKIEERVEGVNYILGDLKEYIPRDVPTPEEIDSSPSVSENEELPF